MPSAVRMLKAGGEPHSSAIFFTYAQTSITYDPRQELFTPNNTVGGEAKGVTQLHDALLVRDHDWQEMGEAILKLSRDPELAKRIGFERPADRHQQL